MAENPSSANVERAIDLFKSGDVDTAVPMLRQAVQDEPGRFDLRIWLGLALAKKEKWVDAERQFEEALNLNGASADAAYFQGMVMAKQGRLREAHSMFLVALGNDPEHAKAKLAAENTAGAAAEVTTEGSSVAMPGGLGTIDLTAVEMEAIAMGGAKPSARPGVPDDVSSALAEMKGARPAEKPAAPPSRVKSARGKQAGCLGGAVLGLLLLPWVAILSVAGRLR